MQIQRSGAPQNAMKFYKTSRHHNKIGKHIVVTKKLTHGFQVVFNTKRSTPVKYVEIKRLDLVTPCPGVVKCFNLSR